MKKNSEFLKEFSQNFSDLYVEAFFLRYLSTYSEKNLLKDIKKLNHECSELILKKFQKSLLNMGYKLEDIQKYIY